MTSVPAKKSLGQNWLVNEGVADRIVQAANLSSSSTVLEVGPGMGVLTDRLSAAAGSVIAVEKDVRLIDSLNDHFSGQGSVRIVQADILELDPRVLGLTGGAYTVVANLPYYITSHVIRKLLTQWPRPQRAILMVQREVAQRMAAQPPDMNLLALSVQLYSEFRKVMDVSRGSFRPSPDVDSAVIALEPKILSALEQGMNKKALELAKGAFGQKRKKLTATLRESKLQSCNIDPSKRPQHIGLQEWLCLARTATD